MHTRSGSVPCASTCGGARARASARANVRALARPRALARAGTLKRERTRAATSAREGERKEKGWLGKAREKRHKGDGHAPASLSRNTRNANAALSGAQRDILRVGNARAHPAREDEGKGEGEVTRGAGKGGKGEGAGGKACRATRTTHAPR
jgi:hypothetical protein